MPQETTPQKENGWLLLDYIIFDYILTRQNFRNSYGRYCEKAPVCGSDNRLLIKCYNMRCSAIFCEVGKQSKHESNKGNKTKLYPEYSIHHKKPKPTIK